MGVIESDSKVESSQPMSHLPHSQVEAGPREVGAS
jgi:hypothetical protein